MHIRRQSEVQKVYIGYNAGYSRPSQKDVTVLEGGPDGERYDNSGWVDGFNSRMPAQKSSSVSFLRWFGCLPFFVRFSNFALGPETWVRSSVLEGLASSS